MHVIEKVILQTEIKMYHVCTDRERGAAKKKRKEIESQKHADVLRGFLQAPSLNSVKKKKEKMKD